jgi:hypothetical protein
VTETCNGHDDDCDGVIDEECDCVHGAFRPCGTNMALGVCRPGVAHCDRGYWGGCQMPDDALPEVCDNGIDDNCDGFTDEGCECLPTQTRECGMNEGTCTFGTMACNDDRTWGTCEGAVGPEHEVCDGLDNDCDGLADGTVRADGSIAFGWTRAQDRFEPNDGCPGYDLGDVYRGTSKTIRMEAGPQDSLSIYPSLSKDNDGVSVISDQDWYVGRATGFGSGFCIPQVGRESYALTASLVLVDALYGEGYEQPWVDYRMCIGFADNCSNASANPEKMICTTGMNFNDQTKKFTIETSTSVKCGERPNFYVHVEAQTDNTCGHYRVDLRVD